jgi:hypothetical protein
MSKALSCIRWDTEDPYTKSNKHGFPLVARGESEPRPITFEEPLKPIIERQNPPTLQGGMNRVCESSAIFSSTLRLIETG